MRLKMACCAKESGQTIQELFLTSILKTCHTLALDGQLRMSVADLYKQQDLVIAHFQKWSMSECYQFAQKLAKFPEKHVEGGADLNKNISTRVILRPKR